ncbi:hypothetical protein HAX54_051257, partial [Datura stramonium]|nr:hypothetical protein [Datura stramonium]
LAINEKGNPSHSIQEEPKIWTNSLNKVPELKRLFEAQNMHWMAESLGKYSMDMMHEFYTNSYYTLEKNALLRTVIKKEPMCHNPSWDLKLGHGTSNHGWIQVNPWH